MVLPPVLLEALRAAPQALLALHTTQLARAPWQMCTKRPGRAGRQSGPPGLSSSSKPELEAAGQGLCTSAFDSRGPPLHSPRKHSRHWKRMPGEPSAQPQQGPGEGPARRTSTTSELLHPPIHNHARPLVHCAGLSVTRLLALSAGSTRFPPCPANHHHM